MSLLINQNQPKHDKVPHDKVPHDKVSKNIKQQINSQKSVDQQKAVKKDHPCTLFILVNICQFYTFFQIYVFFVTTMNPSIPWDGVFGPIIATACFRIFIFMINSMYLARFKTIFLAYTLLDILGVLSACTSVIFVVFQLVITIPMKMVNQKLPLVTYILIPFTHFFNVGNFRLMMITCKWSRWKVITYKLKLYASSFFYLGYGLIYIYQKRTGDYECSACQPQNPQCQHSCTAVNNIVTYCCMDVDNLWKSGINQINQFFILFLAMSLAYVTQLIAVMSDFDGVAQLKTHYTMGYDGQYQNQIKQHKIQPESILNTLGVTNEQGDLNKVVVQENIFQQKRHKSFNLFDRKVPIFRKTTILEQYGEIPGGLINLQVNQFN